MQPRPQRITEVRKNLLFLKNCSGDEVGANVHPA